MIQILIIISVIILLVGLMVKWPRPGLYIFKTVCLMLLLIGLFFALFFTLMGLGKQALNIDLHPWREYVGPRFIGALIVTTVIFIISQIPLLFLKKLSSKVKSKILKIEGLVYVALLILGTGLLYVAVSDRNYPENQVIDKIEDFHARHGQYPKDLSDINVNIDNDSLFINDNVHLGYSCDKNAYTLSMNYEYGSYVYDSRKDRWSEIQEGSSIENYMIAIPKEADDVIISDYDKGELGLYGVSNSEFYQLTQSQYEKAREILIKHFADSIQPSTNGEYLIEHPGGWLEYIAYPYEQYRRQYFGWKDRDGTHFAMVILISKRLIEHYISLGNFEDNGQLFWIEDGGSDEVDVLINLDESKLETFVVHQHG